MAPPHGAWTATDHPGRALTVCEVCALSDLDNISSERDGNNDKHPGLEAQMRSAANPYECKARASALTSASASLIKPRHSSIDRLSRAKTPPELKLLVSPLFIILFVFGMPATRTSVSVGGPDRTARTSACMPTASQTASLTCQFFSTALAIAGCHSSTRPLLRVTRGCDASCLANCTRM